MPNDDVTPPPDRELWEALLGDAVNLGHCLGCGQELFPQAVLQKGGGVRYALGYEIPGAKLPPLCSLCFEVYQKDPTFRRTLEAGQPRISHY